MRPFTLGHCLFSVFLVFLIFAQFNMNTELKVGTLDSLMSLSDDLQKIDIFVEGVVKKVTSSY